jgi:hypothetical protein
LRSSATARRGASAAAAPARVSSGGGDRILYARRRRYDRQRDDTRASEAVFSWAKGKTKRKDWVPPPVYAAVSPGEARPKKKPGPDTEVSVVVDLNDLDGGCARPASSARRRRNREPPESGIRR